jgi:GAF domain-containing protein/PAS domain-containing protein
MLRDGVTNALTNARVYEEERKRAEALAEIDHVKTVFFQNVSHEFCTPLTLMLSPVEEMLASDDAELSPRAKGQLEIVNRNGRRLLRLVNTLLDFSRIEAGRVRATYQPTDLAAYTADLASVFRARSNAPRCASWLRANRCLNRFMLIRAMWEQIVLNLVSNAFKFTLAGEIEVGLRAEDNFAVLTVHDTGIGIAPKEMPRIFERFHRVENALGRTHEGSGIGLVLVQELVRLHSGEIAAASELGRGTTFAIKLPFGFMHLPADQLRDVSGDKDVSLPAGSNPFVEEALRWLPEGDDHSLLATGQNSENEPLTTDYRPTTIDRARILIADDNADMRHYVAGLLSTQYTVQAVADGQVMEDAILAKEALRQSEEKYRTLFTSIDEGYAVVEVMADDNGKWNDFLFLEVNPAFERQTGMFNSVGRTATQILGTPNPAWAQIYGRVAQTGEPIRFEEREETLDHIFDLYAFRLGEAGSRRAAVLFMDITDRKHREAHLAFLAEIQNDCARLSTADEIMQTVGAKIGSYLNLSICAFVDIDEAQDRAIVHHNWHREDASNLLGTYRISEFVSAAFYTVVRVGDMVIVNDTNTDAYTHAQNCAALNIQAFIHVPLLRDGQWKFLFNGYDSRPRQWREDEIELFRELANQIFPRLERARAEEAVAAALQDTQLLRELGVRLVTEDNIQTLYQEIISAAIALTHADAGTAQILDNTTQELVLLATQGFNRTMTEHFHRVDASSNTPCGITLKNGIRSFVDFDVPESEDPDGSMRMHVEIGYLSAQSTPLITRSGRAIGMFSTHWRTHYRPSDRELRFLDLLARQAADLIEQRQTEAERDRLLQQA